MELGKTVVTVKYLTYLSESRDRFVRRNVGIREDYRFRTRARLRFLGDVTCR